VARARRIGRVVPALVAALAAAVVTAAPALADDPLPTVDPSAPTPTSPHPGRPPQGSAPDGSTVGGAELDTRGMVVADDADPVPPGVVAAGWLVADAGTGEVLAARDPHGRYYPASTIKVLTLLTLEPLLDPDLVVTGTPEDEQVEGSRVGLVTGGQYPVSLLFQALILQSGNDAANALARAAGGLDRTIEAMNQTARRIGAYDTVVGTPSGLDVAGQSSSPYDLALIFRELLDNPVAAEVLRAPSAQMPAVPGRSPGYQIQNENPLLDYPGMLGGKTGFTDAARHTYVAAAEREGRRLVVSVMATESTPLRASAQAALLLDWGFAMPADTEGVGRLVEAADLAAMPAPTTGPPGNAPAASPAEPAGNEPGRSPLIGWAIGVVAVGTVAVTLVGRRRAMQVPVRIGADDVPVRRPPPRRPARGDATAPPGGGSGSTPP
jgi:D-alanyl-D-alanine carboxypeptidase (penicillin-binding protein 5/6)